MREIKFRSWYNNKMDYRPHGFDEYFGETMPINEAIECAIKNDKQILMQYTGLKDKNNKEIYESDLIKLCDNIHGYFEVMFINQYVGGWVLVHVDGQVSLGARDQEDLEVIGNIYENPELLEAK